MQNPGWTVNKLMSVLLITFFTLISKSRNQINIWTATTCFPHMSHQYSWDHFGVIQTYVMDLRGAISECARLIFNFPWYTAKYCVSEAGMNLGEAC